MLSSCNSIIPSDSNKAQTQRVCLNVKQIYLLKYLSLHNYSHIWSFAYFSIVARVNVIGSRIGDVILARVCKERTRKWSHCIASPLKSQPHLSSESWQHLVSNYLISIIHFYLHFIVGSGNWLSSTAGCVQYKCSPATILGTPCSYRVGPPFAFRATLVLCSTDSASCGKHSGLYWLDSITQFPQIWMWIFHSITT